MGRGLKSLLVGYLMLGMVITLVTETISAMQGSSRVLGLVSSGAPPEGDLVSVGVTVERLAHAVGIRLVLVGLDAPSGHRAHAGCGVR